MILTSSHLKSTLNMYNWANRLHFLEPFLFLGYNLKQLSLVFDSTTTAAARRRKVLESRIEKKMNSLWFSHLDKTMVPCHGCCCQSNHKHKHMYKVSYANRSQNTRNQHNAPTTTKKLLLWKCKKKNRVTSGNLFILLHFAYTQRERRIRRCYFIAMKPLISMCSECVGVREFFACTSGWCAQQHG